MVSGLVTRSGAPREIAALKPLASEAKKLAFVMERRRVREMDRRSVRREVEGCVGCWVGG